MSKYVDFAALKQSLGIEDTIPLLKLNVKPHGVTYRGPCPTCKTGGDRVLVITPGKDVFFCHAAEKGGDVISLAAHVRNTGMRDAAEFLAQALQTSTSRQGTSTVPRATVPQEQKVGANPPDLSRIADRLLHEHEAVQALGLDAETAEQLGIGYDAKGIMRGRVLLPLYRDGELAGFAGFASDAIPLLKLPSSLAAQPAADPKVVNLAQRRGKAS